MQAIVTKYVPANNTRGSRIKAQCERGSISIEYPHELSGDAVHRAAVKALVARFAKEDEAEYGTKPEPLHQPWLRPFVTGQLPSGNYTHVFLPFHAMEKMVQALQELREGLRGGATMGLASQALDELRTEILDA